MRGLDVPVYVPLVLQRVRGLPHIMKSPMCGMPLYEGRDVMLFATYSAMNILKAH